MSEVFKCIELQAFIEATYAQKENVKMLGGRWEPSRKSWYFTIKHITPEKNIDCIHSFGYSVKSFVGECKLVNTNEKANVLKLLKIGNKRYTDVIKDVKKITKTSRYEMSSYEYEQAEAKAQYEYGHGESNHEYYNRNK